MSAIRAGALLATVLALACYEAPAIVFVAGPLYREVIEISTGLGPEPTIRVGEPLVLRTRRTSGPWQQVDRSAVDPAHCWWAATPPAMEPEVADNVRWRALPEGSAEFNVRYRQDRTRDVRFSEPGIYTLTAESNVGCAGQAATDTLIVRVLPD